MKKHDLVSESIWGIRERLESKMKSKLRIEDDGKRDKGARGGKTKLGKEKDLEDLSKYISSNLERFSLRRIDELQEIIVVRQDLILLRIKSKKESV